MQVPGMQSYSCTSSAGTTQDAILCEPLPLFFIRLEQGLVIIIVCCASSSYIACRSVGWVLPYGMVLFLIFFFSYPGYLLCIPGWTQSGQGWSFCCLFSCATEDDKKRIEKIKKKDRDFVNCLITKTSRQINAGVVDDEVLWIMLQYQL